MLYIFLYLIFSIFLLYFLFSKIKWVNSHRLSTNLWWPKQLSWIIYFLDHKTSESNKIKSLFKQLIINQLKSPKSTSHDTRIFETISVLIVFNKIRPKWRHDKITCILSFFCWLITLQDSNYAMRSNANRSTSTWETYIYTHLRNFTQHVHGNISQLKCLLYL